MNSRRAYPLLIVSMTAFLSGCAETQSAALVQPSPDEIPKFEKRGGKFPVTVGVEGKNEQPTRLIVQKMEPPPLSAEERTALGQHEPIVDYLALYRPAPGPRVAVWSGSVDVGINGETARFGRSVTASRITGVDPMGYGGARTGIDPVMNIRSFAYFSRYRSIGVGHGTAGVDVNIGSRSDVATHELNDQP